MSLAKEPSALASAGPLECASTPPAHSLNSQNQTTDQTIFALAELFPAVFVADRRQPHKPLKIGIHQDLIERGVLLLDESRAAAEESERRLLNIAALNFEDDEDDDYDDDVDEEPEPQVPRVPPFYEEALAFISNFTGMARDLLNWFLSKRTERASLTIEQMTAVSDAYNAKFNRLAYSETDETAP